MIAEYSAGLSADPLHAGEGTRHHSRREALRIDLPNRGTTTPGWAPKIAGSKPSAVHLKLGWRPYLDPAGMERRWRETYERLRRRFLLTMSWDSEILSSPWRTVWSRSRSGWTTSLRGESANDHVTGVQVGISVHSSGLLAKNGMYEEVTFESE